MRDTNPDLQRFTLNQLINSGFIEWHGVKINQPDWSDVSHSIAFSAHSIHGNYLHHLIFNAYWEPLDFDLPPVTGGDKNPWRRLIDTSLDPPQDIASHKDSQPVPGLTYRVGPRSVVFLSANNLAS